MELERIVGKCMAKKPDERYQHADEMVADLRHERRALESTRTGRVETSAVQSPVPAAKKTTMATAEEPAAAPKRKGNSLKFIVPAAIVGAAVVVILLSIPSTSR